MNWFGFSRHTRRSFFTFVGLFSLCLALVVGCARPQGSTPAGTTAGTAGRITMGTTQTVETLDPADAYTIFTGILMYNLGDRLYTYEPGTTELVPQLATAMPTVSDDGLTYVIPLREGVTLHDGTPFNAEVMKFSIDRFMTNGGDPSFLLTDQVESVEATGEYELTLKLKYAFAGFPAILSFWGITPVSPQAYQIAEGSFNPSSFVGSGPYKLGSLNADSIRLDVNENYWGEKPANQGVDIQIFASPANLYNTFRTGGLDVAYQTLDPDQIASLQREAERENWQVIEAGTTVINYMTLNQKAEPTSDVRVRKAIAAMIDRNLIRDRVFQGQAEPLYSLIPTSFDVYQPVFKDAYGDGDFDKARALLTEAGYSESNPLSFEVWYPSASTQRGIIANNLKESIETALPGLVSVTVNSTERATLSENIEKGAYDTVLLNWYPDFYDPDNFIQPFMSCDQGSATAFCQSGASQLNGSFYYSDRANELIKTQRAEQDEKSRNAMFAELQELLVEDVPYIPLWQNKDYVFARDEMQGVDIQPTQQFLLWQMSK